MNTHLGLIGKKLGCTQIFGADGNVTRVTVVEAGPCVVVRKRSVETDGYVALQLAFGERREKLLSLAEKGHFDSNGVKPVTRKNKRGTDVNYYPRGMRELRLSESDAAKYAVGQTLSVSDVFQEGQFVDVTGTTIGRGFSGVIRRHHFAGFVSSHGTHEYFRHGGSIGTNMTPGRTMPGKKMPGQHGNRRRTSQNLKVVRVIPEENLVLITGAVPGGNNGVVTVRFAVKGGKHA